MRFTKREEWQYLDALILNRLQLVRIDMERLENRRGNLRGGHRALDGPAGYAGFGDDQPDIGVAEAKSAVFRVLLARRGIYFTRCSFRFLRTVGTSASSRFAFCL